MTNVTLLVSWFQEVPHLAVCAVECSRSVEKTLGTSVDLTLAENTGVTGIHTPFFTRKAGCCTRAGMATVHTQPTGRISLQKVPDLAFVAQGRWSTLDASCQIIAFRACQVCRCQSKPITAQCTFDHRSGRHVVPVTRFTVGYEVVTGGTSVAVACVEFCALVAFQTVRFVA